MLILILTTSLLTGAKAVLTAFPSNTAVIVGSEVILQCRTNASKKLIWRQRLLNATEKDGPLGVIFSGNRLSHEAAQLYKIINESEGQFDLRFNATLHHGNEYMCQEPGGNNFSIEVIVLAAEPKCYVNGISMISNLILVDEDEYVELKCNLTFAGRWSPTLEWTELINSEKEWTDNSNWVVKSNQEETDGSEKIYFTSSTVGFNATHNVTSFMCSTRFIENNRPKKGINENIPDWSCNWTSPTVVLKSFYESNNMFVTQENYHSDGSIAMTGTSTFLIAAGLVASILLCTCIVAVVTVKLRKSKAQQSPADHPTQDATSNPVHPTTHRPTRLTTNSHVVIELQQPVIYSDVAKKSVKRQEDLQSNDLGRDLQHPVIYSDVYDPDATQTVQASSLQCENSCKITGADGTEYSLLPVFHAKQPLAQTKAKNKLYETSVYAPIDHTIVPLPPTCHRRESEH